jgi:hypothetical protein
MLLLLTELVILVCLLLVLINLLRISIKKPLIILTCAFLIKGTLVKHRTVGTKPL